MDDSFEQLVDGLAIAPLSIDILRKITFSLQQQTSDSFSPFISHCSQSLHTLKEWTWQQFSRDSHEWTEHLDYVSLFETIALFNKKLIFNYDQIDSDIKAALVIPATTDRINNVFQQINQSTNDNDPFITIVSLYFDNLSSFLHENPHYDTSTVISALNHYIGRNYLITDQFKFYVNQLRHPNLSQSIFTARQLFYIKTCSSCARSYLSAKAQKFVFTREEMLYHISNEYLQIMSIHCQSIESWSTELLNCIAHLTGLILVCYWWGGEKITQRTILFSTEQLLCDFVQSLIRILSYEPFHEKLRKKRYTDEAVLIYIVVKILLGILQTENINWFFRSYLSLPDVLFKVAELSPCNQVCLCAYGILGEILTDDKVKELTFVDRVGNFFFDILEQGWHNPLRKYKQIPVLFLLRSFAALSKSDAIQQRVAGLYKLPLFIEMCDEYSVVFDIIWGLSFNQDIQQQIRSNGSFIDKLSRLAKEGDNEHIQKVTSGILWNLEINHEDRSLTKSTDENRFDLMISYSHKDKVLCKQLYDELIKGGYRVWIDFDQMHGNVMDAMAQAIDRSQTIIICMSEQYRKSNYCRAEAHYAFQRQRKIVPVLMQEHYKPDGWLLFLVGQLLYVDFTKYEFTRAMEMLMKELKATDVIEDNGLTVQCQPESIVTPMILSTAPIKLVLPPILPKNIMDWTQAHVQEWLQGNNLPQLSQLLSGFNGHSLLYFNDFIRHGDVKQILNCLHEDSLRKTGQTLSLIELSCFQSLMDFNVASNFPKANNNIDKKRSFICCRMM